MPGSPTASFNSLQPSPATPAAFCSVTRKLLSPRAMSSSAGSSERRNRRPGSVKKRYPATPPMTAPASVTAIVRELSRTGTSTLEALSIHVPAEMLRRGRRRRGRCRGVGTCGLAGIANVVLLHLAVERRAVEAEDLRGLLLVPVRTLQRLQNRHLLDLRERAMRWNHEVRRAGRLLADRFREIGHDDLG